MVMQIAVKVETGFDCNWRNIEPLQPEGFKGQTANEKETLKNSIVKNGFHDAFDVWQHDNKLLSIDGVHRKIALLELAEEGYEIPEQLPCTYVTAENETEAATIILSRNSQHSHILSAAVMTAAFKIPAAIIEAVVPQKNLEAWSESDNSITEQLTAEEDDFEFEDGGIETDIVIGDLFEIGVHRLLCGDSTCSDSVERLMDGVKADMVFTSPPYNSGGNSGTGGYRGNNKREVKEFYNDQQKSDNWTKEGYFDFCISVLSNIAINCNNDTTILWNVMYNANSRDDYGKIIFSDLNPFTVKETIIWDKGVGMNICSTGILSRTCELIFLMSKGNKYYTNQIQDTYWNVWRISNKDGENMKWGHGASFPIKLPSEGISRFSKELHIIYEPFCGSGSTMVAAHQLNRKCYGMELEPKYCQVILDRMRKLDPTLIIKRNGVIYE